MFRRALGIVLLVVSFNFLFLADSVNHAQIGWIWLAIAVIALWPEISKLKFVK